MANPILAAILSIVIPGLGQFYDGHFLRGVGVAVIFWLLAGGSVATLFVIPFVLPVVTGVFWLWNIYDAYSLAR